jgi:hypothetical protein
LLVMWSAPFATGATLNTSRQVGIRPRSAHRPIRSGVPDGDRRPDSGHRAACANAVHPAGLTPGNQMLTRSPVPPVRGGHLAGLAAVAGGQSSLEAHAPADLGMEPPRPEAFEPNLAARQCDGLTNCRMRACMSGGVGGARRGPHPICDLHGSDRRLSEGWPDWLSRQR